MSKYAPNLPENLKHLSDEEVDIRIKNAKKRLGDSLLILAHHYQRDEIVEYADITGDSFALAKAVIEWTLNRGKKVFFFPGQHLGENTAYVGSTAYIIKKVDESSSGTKWGIGTEKDLVNRLKGKHSDKLIMLLHEGEPGL